MTSPGQALCGIKHTESLPQGLNHNHFYYLIPMPLPTNKNCPIDQFVVKIDHIFLGIIINLDETKCTILCYKPQGSPIIKKYFTGFCENFSTQLRVCCCHQLIIKIIIKSMLAAMIKVMNDL